MVHTEMIRAHTLSQSGLRFSYSCDGATPIPGATGSNRSGGELITPWFKQRGYGSHTAVKVLLPCLVQQAHMDQGMNSLYHGLNREDTVLIQLGRCYSHTWCNRFTWTGEELIMPWFTLYTEMINIYKP